MLHIISRPIIPRIPLLINKCAKFSSKLHEENTFLILSRFHSGHSGTIFVKLGVNYSSKIQRYLSPRWGRHCYNKWVAKIDACLGSGRYSLVVNYIRLSRSHATNEPFTSPTSHIFCRWFFVTRPICARLLRGCRCILLVLSEYGAAQQLPTNPVGQSHFGHYH